MRVCHSLTFTFFFFNATATTEIYTLSLHDALPISNVDISLRSKSLDTWCWIRPRETGGRDLHRGALQGRRPGRRSEEHTSELQSQSNLVCRLLLEKKKNKCR